MASDATTDPYAHSAEFYDVMALPHWETKREFLVSALRDADPITCPILDIGAGSGLSTMTILETVGEVAVHAVEPSAAMRAALVSRVLAGGDAAARVTVHADPVEDVAFPDRVGAAALMGVIGYLSPAARDELWANLRARLTPTAPVVVEFMPLTFPASVPEITIAQRRIGTRVAEVRISGEPASAVAERWTMRYLVREDDRVVRDFTTEHVWHTVGAEDLARDAERHDMTCEQVSPIVVVLRPASG